MAGKPSVAILGLEVVDASGSVDPEAVKVAKELTDGLRARAKVGNGPYTLAPGSDKELIDEKLIKNCDTEAIPCMSQIGKDLGANYLIYGRLEKKPDGYAVTINLLNIDKRKFEKSKTPLTIPFAQKDSASLAAAAKRAYNDLTGVAEAGTLVVSSNAPTGEVFLDEVSKGFLTNGGLTIERLPEGRYRLAVQADNYKRAEVVVTIRSGETTPQKMELVAIDMNHRIEGTTSTPPRKSNIWKPVSIGLGVLTVGATGVWAWSYFSEVKAAEREQDAINTALRNGNKQFTGTLDSDKLCTSEYLTVQGGNDADRSALATLHNSCSKRKLATGSGIAAITLGVATLITGYLAITSSSGETPPPPPTVGRRKTRGRQISVTPILSPDGGGATVRLDW